MVRGTLVQPEKKNYGRLSRRSIDFLQEKRQEEAEILANEIKDGCEKCTRKCSEYIYQILKTRKFIFSIGAKENSKYAPIPCKNPTEKIAKLTNDVAVNRQNDRNDFHVINPRITLLKASTGCALKNGIVPGNRPPAVLSR